MDNMKHIETIQLGQIFLKVIIDVFLVKKVHIQEKRQVLALIVVQVIIQEKQVQVEKVTLVQLLVQSVQLEHIVLKLELLVA